MKKWIAWMMVGISLNVGAATLYFDNAVGHSGANLDELTPSGSQVAVPEFSGLNLTATFGAIGGTVDYLNSTSTQLGINSDLTDEGTSLFDPGEWLAFAFDQDVNVTRFKFTDFTSGDSVKITWGATSLTLNDTDLNTFNEYTVDWDVSANDTIRFDALGKSAATSTGGFGLEEMDVVPEPATFALVGVGGVLAFLTRRRVMS